MTDNAHNSESEDLGINDDDLDDIASMEISDEEMAELTAMLGDASMWDEPSSLDEGAIIAAISAERAAMGDNSSRIAPIVDLTGSLPTEQPSSLQSAASELPGNVVPISSARRWFGPVAAGVAAAVVLFVAMSALSGGAQDTGGVEVALAGTDLAPDGAAIADVSVTANGTRIILDVSGLPPAAEGTYYEAWLRQSPEVGVSAGTFHLRGAGADGTSAEIELWAGVTPDNYPILTVTLQEEGQAASSGQVVLAGRLDS